MGQGCGRANPAIALRGEEYVQINFQKIGDYYEAFGNEARMVARALTLTLTKDGKGTPMCGIPYHGILSAVQELRDKGFTVTGID